MPTYARGSVFLLTSPCLNLTPGRSGHGGQGESLVHPYTRGIVSLSRTLSLTPGS